jgi:hypothetical protein
MVLFDKINEKEAKLFSLKLRAQKKNYSVRKRFFTKFKNVFTSCKDCKIKKGRRRFFNKITTTQYRHNGQKLIFLLIKNYPSVSSILRVVF